MQTYHCKRYRRTAPGTTTATLTDQLRFEADDATAAETAVRKGFRSGVVPMAWDKEYAILEDRHGNIVTLFLDGMPA
jgi:hypothetical protein